MRYGLLSFEIRIIIHGVVYGVDALFEWNFPLVYVGMDDYSRGSNGDDFGVYADWVMGAEVAVFDCTHPNYRMGSLAVNVLLSLLGAMNKIADNLHST